MSTLLYLVIGLIGGGLIVARVPASVERWLGERFGPRAASVGVLPAVLATGVRDALVSVVAHLNVFGELLRSEHFVQENAQLPFAPATSCLHVCEHTL